MIGTEGWGNLVIDPSTWRGYPEGYPRKVGGSFFYPLDSGTYNDINYLKAFRQVPELSAVINLKARSFANGRLKVVNSKGEEIENHWLMKLLNKPNWFQDIKELMRQTKIFHDLYGNEYLYNLVPFGMNPKRVKALFTLPPNLLEIQFNEPAPFWTFSEKPEGVIYKFKGEDNSSLPSDNIIHMNDNKVTVTKKDDKSILMGESKLISLAAPVNNIREAYIARGMIIKYRGAQGIISPDASSRDVAGFVPLDKTDKKLLTERYANEYGTQMGQSQMMIVDTAIKFQSMTVNEPKKLGLFEETMHDFYKIIDAYGCKREQFVMTEGSTYENQDQANKAFYQDTAIPEANEWVQGLNQKYLPDSKEKLIIDYSHLPLFQEDIKLKSETLERMVNSLSIALQDKVITIDEYKEEIKKLGIGKSE